MFDLEAFQSKRNLPNNSQSLEFMAHHELLSAAVISTCPGYTEAKVFMVSHSKTQEVVVVEMLRYMNDIARCVERLLKPEFQGIFQQIEERLKKATSNKAI